MSAPTVNLTLRKWNPKSLKRDRRMILVGKPGTGKSVAAVDVMYHIRNMNEGVVFSPTDRFTGIWESHVPPISVYDKWDNGVVKKIIKRQERLFNQDWHRLLQEQRNGGPRALKSNVKIPPVYIIADDCLADGQFLKDPILNDLFFNGRHLKIFFLVTSQWLMKLKIEQRQTVDYLLVTAEDSPPALKRLYENFFSNYIPTYSAFCDIMAQTTSDYGMLVLDRTNQYSKKIEDHVFWWRAQEHEPGSFRIGCQQFWEFSKTKYQDTLELPNFAESQQSYMSKPNTSSVPRVIVKRLDDDEQ